MAKRKRRGKRAAPLPRKSRGADRRTLLAVIVVGLIAVALFGRTIGFDFTRTDDKVLIHDDAVFITDLGNVLATFQRPFFAGGSRGERYYRPLVTITLMLDAQLSGTKPFAYHLTNLVLHVVVVALILLVLLRLGLSLWLATGAAGLFAVHPALIETVAWIPGRCDSLLAVFGLAGLLCLFRWLECGRTRWLLAHAGLLLCALLAKEAAVVFPAISLMCLAVDDERRNALKRPRLWAAWVVPLVIWFVLWRGVAAEMAEPSLVSRLRALIENLPVVLMHLGKIVFPYRLAVLAYSPDTPWIPGAVALAGFVAAAIWVKGTSRRLLLLGGGWFLLFVLPSLPVSDYLILENRLYLPAIGILIAVAAIVAHVVANGLSRRIQVLLGAVASLGGIVFIALGWSYSGNFRNPDRFTRQAVMTSPHSALAQLNRGTALHAAEQFSAAEVHYRAALRLNANQAVANNNLGLLMMRRGLLAEAERLYRQEIEINPNYDIAHYNLGLVLQRTGRQEQAVLSWRRAAQINPNNADALGHLYGYYFARGNVGEATNYRRQLERLGLRFPSTASATR